MVVVDVVWLMFVCWWCMYVLGHVAWLLMVVVDVMWLLLARGGGWYTKCGDADASSR